MTAIASSSLTQQAYRFALAPTAAQEEFLGACAGASRYWFNQGLALVKQRLNERAAGNEKAKVPWSYKGLCTAFKGEQIKNELAPWRSEVVTGSYQAGLESLGRALQNFTEGRRTGRKVGFPEYRCKGRCHESIIFQRPRLIDSRHVELDRRLGPIRVKESMRKLTRLLSNDPNARVLRSTVQRCNGGWVISFTVQRSRKQRRARQPNGCVGVDVGLHRLATLSTGNYAANSRPLRGGLRTLRRLQRQLDRQRRANNPGNYHPDGRARQGRGSWVKSSRMLRTEQRISSLHKRVADLRREQAHQLTTALTREIGIIGVESLAVKNMMRDRKLARHISDVGWGMILAQLKYKTVWSEGSMLVAADRFYPSSKTCSSCGSVKAKLGRGERVFNCDECGHEQDRDLNAALNLAQLAERFALAEGRVGAVVARTGRFTLIARGGHVSLDPRIEQSPVKREDSPSREPTQRREALVSR